MANIDIVLIIVSLEVMKNLICLVDFDNADYAASGCAPDIRRRAKPTSPIMPVAKSTTAAGTGTALTLTTK
jgi:hypothetical protein